MATPADNEATLVRLEADMHAIRRCQEAESSTSARVWDIATKLAVPAVLALLGWLWRVDRDHIRMASDVMANARAIGAVDEAVRTMPPQWLRDVVVELKSQNSDILQRLARLEAQVSALKKD